jgi:3',5'-nucleoside bisphosphate phosphatase
VAEKDAAEVPRSGGDAASRPESQPAPFVAYRATTGPRVVAPYPSRVDLHTHSRRSDGVLEPAELIDAAAAAGVRILALADHDTLAGVRELCGAAQPLPLELIAGVEINSIARGIPGLAEGELHVLGLGVDVDDDEFEATLRRQREMRAARFHRIVARLRGLGMPVDAEVERYVASDAYAEGRSLGRPVAARALVAAGHAESVDDAMKRLLARGRPAFVPRDGLGPIEAIHAIAAARGIPVLAHFADAPDRVPLLRRLMDEGLRGLEVHYRHFDAATVEALARVAANLRLVPTGGSDYHGDDGAYAAAHAQLFVPDEDATALEAALASPATARQSNQ